MFTSPPPTDASLGPTLFACARLFDEFAQAQVNAELGERIARPALMRLLPFLDDIGVRPTELARRTDSTKQAIGQTLRALEARGLVEFTPDPSDGRAQLVRLTSRGVASYAHGHDVLAFFEQELTQRLGERGMRQLQSTLTAMLSVLREWEATGAPTRASKTAVSRTRVQRSSARG